jgi:hypothetical protein
VSFAAITLYVASQPVFVATVFISLSIQSGNFWMRPRMATCVETKATTFDMNGEPLFSSL